MSKTKPLRNRFVPALVFAALGDDTRLSLLQTLSDGRQRSITVLSDDSHLTRQAVTRHLFVLEHAGLVSITRLGRESLFSAEPEMIRSARTYLDTVSEQWDDALRRLSLHLGT
jgi:DNA-binding transcriptional ArsR family regulator